MCKLRFETNKRDMPQLTKQTMPSESAHFKALKTQIHHSKLHMWRSKNCWRFLSSWSVFNYLWYDNRLRHRPNDFRNQFSMLEKQSWRNWSNLIFGCGVRVVICVNGAKSWFLIVSSHNFTKCLLHLSAWAAPWTEERKQRRWLVTSLCVQ